MIEAKLISYGSIQVVMREAYPPTFMLAVGNSQPIQVNVGLSGPRGAQGPPGDLTQSSIGSLADVELTETNDGDTLIYADGAFRNQPIGEITDGGNF